VTTEPLHRGVIVARIAPGTEQQVADAFRRSDASDLPRLAGVVRRGLYRLGDVYVHVVDTRTDFDEVVQDIHAHPLFTQVSAELARYVTPYDPEAWRSPRDASATCFYEWHES
jgi:cyclase